MNDDLKIIFCNESAFKSIFNNVITFAILIALLFVNYNWLGDSTLITLFIIICFFIELLIYGDKKIKKMTPEEALKYLSEKYRQ